VLRRELRRELRPEVERYLWVAALWGFSVLDAGSAGEQRHGGEIASPGPMLEIQQSVEARGQQETRKGEPG